MKRTWRLGVALATTTALAAGMLGTLQQAQAAPAAPSIVVHDGVTQPVFSFADAIREQVWVQAPFDGDGDGKLDLIATNIVRPRETEQGLKVPVIMDPSPYYGSLGRGNESQVKTYDANGNPLQFPLFYDNYFVPRGYAIVQPDMAGTSKSDGCVDIGGPYDVGSMKAVVDWLNGRAVAYTAQTAAPGTEISAGWTTGKVGAFGKSYDGALVNGLAATGVDGLATIIPISGISNEYTWYRANGLRYSNWHEPLSLADVVYSPLQKNKCAAARAALTAGAAATTGNYNDFWDDRNFLKDASNVKASVFIVHGLNDLNVKMDNVDHWWDALAKNNVPRKIWLSQYGHVDPFDYRRADWVDTVHRWLDYWLQGIDNGIMDKPQADIEVGPDQWETQPSWPLPGTHQQVLRLGPANADGPGTLTVSPVTGTQKFLDGNQTEATMTANFTSTSANRLMFLSPVLDKPVRLSGTPIANIRAIADQTDTNLTMLVVDYGTDTRVDNLGSGEGVRTLTTSDCWGESTAYDSACYKKVETVTKTAASQVVSRGWINASHRQSLTSQVPLVRGEEFSVSWEALPQDYTFKPGHRIGIVIAGNQSGRTIATTTRANVTVLLGESSVTLPIVGYPVDAWLPANSQVITADVQPGQLALSVSSSAVTMPPVTLTGFDQFVDGALNNVTVADGRGTGAGWSLTGQTSDFVGPNGLILADNLGWGPNAQVTSGTLPTIPSQRSAVTAGAVAIPGTGTGLANSKTLCTSGAGTSAGAFTCGGTLKLGVPGSTKVGTYTGVLTLTLV